MTLNIGSNIRMLRAERGLTQEKLAEHLGVSCQAVSKWESGNGYPDIEFIPALAYYFDVTTDELLGVDSSRNSEIIDGYMKRYSELTHDRPAQLALIREAVAQFPNNFQLLQCLMYALVFNISIHKQPDTDVMITKATALEETPNRELLNEAVVIAERILKECTDERIRHSAVQMLCYYYPLLDKMEDAILLAKSMPPLFICRDALLEEIYSGEEKIRQIQLNICRMTDYLCCDIISVADPDGQQGNNISVDEKIHLINTANNMYHLVFENGDFNMRNSRLAHNYRLMAALALLDKQADRALDYLEEAAAYAIAADTVANDAPFTSLAVNRLVNDVCKEFSSNDSTDSLNRLFYLNTVENRIVLKIDSIEANQSGYLLKKLEQSRYDVIRNDNRFISVENRLRQHA